MSDPIIGGTRGTVLCSWNAQTASPEWYGGSVNKEDCDEGEIPYAAVFYKTLQDAQGSAYSKALSGPLHWENLADARVAAAMYRCAEKLQKNASPSRADEGLYYWTEVLGVSVSPYDTDEDIREKCSARYKGFSGNSFIEVTNVVQGMLNDALSSIKRFIGLSFGEWPEETRWVKNPGPTYLDLGRGYNETGDHPGETWRRGAWYSDRSRLLIEVVRGALPERIENTRLNIDMRDSLQRMLPSWTTWQWAYEGGFVLDKSKLDVSALAPEEP